MALSIFVPIGYITILVVSLSVFSRVYRKRSARALAKEHASWFPEGHPERDVYQTLVLAAANSNDGTEGKQATIPEVVLKAALLNRAMTDVRRIIRMRDDKQALAVLLQKGSIGDETMARFGMAEKELEAEILDVVSEANTFKEGWGQLIFPSASEMVAHLKHKEVYYDIHKQRAEETKKLVDAGKPVPQSRVPLPPLVTPAGTSITIGTPPQQGSSGSNTPLKVNAPQTNGTTAAAKAAAGSGKAATTVEEAADDDQTDEREGSAASAKTNGEAAASRREASAASSSNQTISSLGDDDGAEDEEAQGAKGQQLGDGGPSLVDANQSNGQQGGANRAARRRANKNKGKK